MLARPGARKTCCVASCPTFGRPSVLKGDLRRREEPSAFSRICSRSPLRSRRTQGNILRFTFREFRILGGYFPIKRQMLY